jgi:hypothetical protein
MRVSDCKDHNNYYIRVTFILSFIFIIVYLRYIKTLYKKFKIYYLNLTGNKFPRIRHDNN